MKRHGHLFEQVTEYGNLLAAAHRARKGKRDRVEVARFVFDLEPNLLQLQEELRSGSYRMRPYRAFVIREPKRRRICAAHFRDRVVHHAVCAVLDPIFEACLIGDTYACRRGKGTHAAVRRLQRFARRFPYVLMGDVRRYFESVDHEVLKALCRRKLKDKALLSLLDRIIDHPLPGGRSGKGVPIGNLDQPVLRQSVSRGIGPFGQGPSAPSGVCSLHGRLCCVRRWQAPAAPGLGGDPRIPAQQPCASSCGRRGRSWRP